MSAIRYRNEDALRLSARLPACSAAGADARKSGLRSRDSAKHDTTVTSTAAATHESGEQAREIQGCARGRLVLPDKVDMRRDS
jgi:hypothetical protein